MSFSMRPFPFLKISGLALCLASIAFSASADTNGTNLLPVPPLLESRSGQPLFLTLQKIHWSFDGKSRANIWGVNGSYPGPTVRVKNGDDIKLIYSNRLPEAVSMTVSGLQVPGTQIGGAARLISPGADWSPVIPIRQPAATLWYHANTEGKMGSQVYNGLVGMWIIDDDSTKNLRLPKHYGVDDFPVIIQDKRLDNFGTPEYQSSENGFVGDTLLVNGVQDPYIEVSRGWIRLRLLNASNSRRYIMNISDGRPFYLIASDQGLLTAPVQVQSLPLAPGERKEILIDMAKTEEVSITAGEPAGFMERMKGLFEPSSLLVSTNILTIRATGLMSLVTDDVPARLVDDNTQITTSIRNREIRLDDPAGINGATRDVKRIDLTTEQGSWERWAVNSEVAQPFHIEGARFKVINHNGQPVSADDFGWKDTVWVEGRTELLVEMLQPSFNHFPFLFYSQNLEKADLGSVGQMVINPQNP
ncbi:cell division protein FtsP [Moellerella wisconsensis]|uniref:Cell division protein FtsP n=1 Tax=Moellerella wisconsensis TaxID=158849 RepID=A0ACD3YAA6_9GAMM|nr:cell division protein FtsP [Moellerella wisconsensis]UNH27754.1 cell division protein FtsP [Moellerella wisconsensis]UNH39374.1 cell division protein FtsP [Moellerella wisconsensis]UNH42897.1 cell division protein FtsP [Moellerella wisconsensis]WJW82347.1 cell division protein FtsP [Moellerella wisconsensis]